jgi:hypothetical protein
VPFAEVTMPGSLVLCARLERPMPASMATLYRDMPNGDKS